MYNIILDTSFILTALKFKIDFFSELNRICEFNYRISIVNKTLNELKNKNYEKLALRLIKEKNVNIINTSEKGNVDSIIVNLAEKDKDIIVATQDIKLKNRLNKANTRLISIKQKKYLIFV